MARIRSVKPELRVSEIVASWDREVRYFWVLLWGYLDDYGRGVDNPKLIKADCFPLDDDVTSHVIDEWLDLIATAGPICRYESGGRRYLHAVNWAEHQRPSHPTDSRHPYCTRTHDAEDTDRQHPAQEGSGISPESSRAAPESSRVAREPSGTPPERLVPEQVVRAGSREQGPRAYARGGGAAVDNSNNRTAELVIAEATGATRVEAATLAAAVARDRKPRSLPGLLRTMARDGDLAAMLADLRAVARRADTANVIAAAREGPPCEHHEPGGSALHPTSGMPLCALCRGARASPAA